jgi:CRP/FNR family transcriptional regulator, cyclic AMP receptor protein
MSCASLVQDYSQKRFIDLDFTVAFDEAQFPEFVHEEIHARTRSSHHACQGLLRNLRQNIQKGGVKFSVVNGSGKEAVVAMFGPTDFFGEGCMAGQTVRMGTTTAITPTTLLVIQKEELLRVLHAEHELSDHFIAYMLAHNIRVQEDLIDQLFNSSEKRLARALLLLAR